MFKIIFGITSFGVILTFVAGHLVAGSILAVLTVLFVGALIGEHAERQRWQRTYPDLDEPPPD